MGAARKLHIVEDPYDTPEERRPLTAMAKKLQPLVQSARSHGFRVDGVELAERLLSETELRRIRKLLFGEAALTFFRQKASRIEFIADGMLPAELLREPTLKNEVVYRQEIDYDICKSCRLCIEVCPKHVYTDDGFGKPDEEVRRAEECTGLHQCGQCADVCPEDVIRVVSVEPIFDATVFVLLPAAEDREAPVSNAARDFMLRSPLDVGGVLELPKKLNVKRLRQCHETLDAAHFHPLLQINGYDRHFVDAAEPEKDLSIWAGEQARDPEAVLAAVELLYKQLGRLSDVRKGRYRLDDAIHRIIDEILHAGIKLRTNGAREMLARILRDAYVDNPFLGAKDRPIGGLLPTGTSSAWKTPYGEEIPDYVHLEKCLGPECGLCVTHCPEGGGGKNSAIRMNFNVPQGTVPSLVRGAKVFLLRVDGSHRGCEEFEDLSGQRAFEFEVNPDYCKACGICIACCPHDVIKPVTRAFDLRQKIL